MSEIKRSRHIIKIINEKGKKANSHKMNKTNSKFHEFLFFPLMDITKKFKISNKFDEKHSKHLLEEKDKYLEVVELDDKLPEDIEEIASYKISKIDPLNITFGI